MKCLLFLQISCSFIVFVASELSASNSVIYLGGSIGRGDSNLQSHQFSQVNVCDKGAGCNLDNDFRFFAAFLGCSWGKYLATEVGYSDFGKVFSFAKTDSGTLRARQDSYGVYALKKLRFPLNELLGSTGTKMEIYGKLGVIFWNSQIRLTDETGLGLENANSDTQLMFGIGISQGIAKNVDFAVEWNRYRRLGDSPVALVSASKVETVDITLSALSLSLSYKTHFRF